MKKIQIFLLSSLLMFPYTVVFAEQGVLSRELRDKINNSKARIETIINEFKKDKNIGLLDEGITLISQAYDDVYSFYERAANKELGLLRHGYKVEKLKAKIDMAEIRLIGAEELPYLCDKFYEIGQLYSDVGEKKKAKEAFRNILIKFTTNEFKSCNKKAEFALEDLKEN